MTTIQGQIHTPGGVPHRGVYVLVELWGEGTPELGFADGIQIAAPIKVVPDEDGAWDLDIENANLDIEPAGTVYRVAVHWAGGQANPFYIDVPASGSHNVEDLLVDPPGSLASAGLTAEIARATAQELLKVAKAGDTMTGPLVLPGNPASALQAAPKQYVDAAITAVKGAATSGGDTLGELETRLAVVEALGSLATDAELVAAVVALIGSADTSGDTLGELQALIGARLLKSANLSDVANPATALANLGGQPAGTYVATTTSAAQAAFAAAADGSTIVLEGDFTLNGDADQLSWTGKRLNVKTHKKARIIEGSAMTVPMMDVTNATGSTVEGLEFVGLETAVSFDGLNSARIGLRFTSSDDVTTRDVKVSAKSYGQNFVGCNRARVHSPKFVGFATSLLTGVNFHSGIYFKGGVDCRVIAPDARDVGSSLLAQANGSSDIPTRLTILSPTGEGFWDNAVYISSGDNCMVMGADFKTIAGAGIKMRGSRHKCVLFSIEDTGVGVSITGNGTTPDSYGSNGYGNIVSHGTVLNAQQDGLSFGGQDGYYQRHATCDHVTIKNSALSGGGYGALRATCTFSKFDHISIENCDGTTAAVVIAGDVADASTYFQVLQGMEVTNFSIVDSASDGMRLFSMADSHISRNHGENLVGGDLLDLRTVTTSIIESNDGRTLSCAVRTDSACVNNRIQGNIGAHTLTGTGRYGYSQVDSYVVAGSYTWSRPQWATAHRVIVSGGSGGSGSGRKRAVGSIGSGGGGGASGGVSTGEFPSVSGLGSTINVTVGAGGTGGAAQTTNSTDGNPGSPGGASFLGATATSALVGATGGGAGGGGTAAAGGAAGSAGSGEKAGAAGGLSPSGGTVGGVGAAGAGSGGGGGAGGGVTAAEATSSGGVGGRNNARAGVSTLAGGTAGNPGTSATSPLPNGAIAAHGAGGGGSSVSGNGGAGGAGLLGSGGGGGGAATDGTGNSGAGGNGGDGWVVIISYG